MRDNSGGERQDSARRDRGSAITRVAFGRSDVAAGAAIALLTVYSAARAALLPMTIDESVSYLYFARAPVVEIFSPDFVHSPIVNPGWAANNHILNSLFEKLSAALLGPSAFALRLPNLLSLILYLGFSWLLLRALRPRALALAGFLLLACNPFLLDYFSLSRGYGLSLGFLMAGLFFLWGDVAPWIDRRSGEWLGWFCVALGVLASFVLLDVYVALAVVVTILGRPGAPRQRGGILAFAVNSVPMAVTGVLLAGAIVPNVLGLKRIGALYFGGRSGFWKDTVGSLVDASLYTAGYAARARPVVLGAVAVLSLFVAGSAVAALVGRSTDPRRLAAARWASLLFLSVAMSILEHRAFKANFRLDRTALYFLPLFVLAVASFFESAADARNRIGGRIARAAPLILAGAALLHLAASMNFERFLFFAEEMSTPELLGDLARLHASSQRAVTLQTEWRLAPTIDFYRVTKNLSWLTWQAAWETEKANWQNANVAYVFPSHREELERRGFRLLKIYPRTGNVLGERPSGGP